MTSFGVFEYQLVGILVVDEALMELCDLSNKLFIDAKTPPMLRKCSFDDLLDKFVEETERITTKMKCLIDTEPRQAVKEYILKVANGTMTQVYDMQKEVRNV